MHHTQQQAQQSADYASKYKEEAKRSIRNAGATTRGPGSGIYGRGW